MAAKDSYVDVKVRLSDNKQILIEMQMCKTVNFARRVVYNAAHAFISQLRKGVDYDQLANVISLNIVNFTLHKHRNNVVTDYTFMSREDYDEYFVKGIIQVLFVELPKFKKQEAELFNKMDKWFYFLKNVEHLTSVPEVLEEEAPIKEAFELLNEDFLTEDESKTYLERKEFLINNVGFQEEVREEGREEGKEEQKKITAQKLLAAGIDQTIIVQATGLSIAQLDSINTTS